MLDEILKEALAKLHKLKINELEKENKVYEGLLIHLINERGGRVNLDFSKLKNPCRGYKLHIEVENYKGFAQVTKVEGEEEDETEEHHCKHCEH